MTGSSVRCIQSGANSTMNTATKSAHTKAMTTIAATTRRTATTSAPRASSTRWSDARGGPWVMSVLLVEGGDRAGLLEDLPGGRAGPDPGRERGDRGIAVGARRDEPDVAR